jgi:hypothetical protein
VSLHEFAVEGHWRGPGVVAMTDTVSSDEQALREALAQEFGRPFDIARLDIDARFVYDHACRIGEEALSSALWPGVQGQMLPYRLLVGFFESSRLNAGTLDLTDGASLVALTASFPVALLGAFAAVAQRMETGSALPQRDAQGRVVVFADRLELFATGADGGMKNPDTAASLTAVLHALAQTGRLPQAMLLYDLAIRFVVMHECMHIVLGHTGYVRRELRVSRLMEMGAMRRGVLTPDVSQALEFIADRHAVRGVVQWARSGRLGKYVDAVQRDPALTREQYLLRALTLALMTLLLLFPSRATARASSRDSHPHPYTRMRWLCREIGQELPSRDMHVKAVLEPMAFWTASFQRNFSTPGRWERAIREDQQEGNGLPPLSDRAYADITAVARQWQTRLWQGYSPVYPGDGRDFESMLAEA